MREKSGNAECALKMIHYNQKRGALLIGSLPLEKLRDLWISSCFSIWWLVDANLNPGIVYQ